MGKYVSSPANGADVVQGLVSLRKDSGCEARITVALAQDEKSLLCTVETYTDHGSRIGVAREQVVWVEGGLPLVGTILTGLFKAYARSSELAHGDGVKHPSLRRR